MSEPRRSITFTVLIFFGMLVALVGLVVLLFGLGGSTSFEFSISDLAVKTTSVGLAILALGAGLSAVIALNLPDEVQVFGETPATLRDRLKAFSLVFVGVAVVAGVALVISLVI